MSKRSEETDTVQENVVNDVEETTDEEPVLHSFQCSSDETVTEISDESHSNEQTCSRQCLAEQVPFVSHCIK